MAALIAPEDFEGNEVQKKVKVISILVDKKVSCSPAQKSPGILWKDRQANGTAVYSNKLQETDNDED